jgi:hypothetical protein
MSTVSSPQRFCQSCPEGLECCSLHTAAPLSLGGWVQGGCLLPIGAVWGGISLDSRSLSRSQLVAALPRTSFCRALPVFGFVWEVMSWFYYRGLLGLFGISISFTVVLVFSFVVVIVRNTIPLHKLPSTMSQL